LTQSKSVQRMPQGIALRTTSSDPENGQHLL
jgi:hypothetical protein